MKSQMHVYQMNDCDWMAARHPAEALQAYAETLGYNTIEDLVRDGMVDNEIVECSLDTEMHEDLSDRDLGMTTYRAVIEERLARGNTDPFFIASTEY